MFSFSIIIMLFCSPIKKKTATYTEKISPHSLVTKALLVCGIINPRRACAARVTVVGSVCVCVRYHLTNRPANDTT